MNGYVCVYREVSQLRAWTIHPRSRAYSAWWISFTAFSVFAMLFTTTVIAFFDTNLIAVFAGDGEPVTGLSVAIIEIVIDVVWALDSVLTFCVAFYKDGALITSRRAIALHYAVIGSMDSGWFADFIFQKQTKHRGVLHDSIYCNIY